MEKQQRDLFSYPFKKYLWHTCYGNGAMLGVWGTNDPAIALKKILLTTIIITATNTPDNASTGQALF